ncbi:MAG: carbohydrate binding family 9 domain-containing protein [Acidobacteria bacterium]|nr:carbohydrate binding family 9 domain-containing protein [Acidobacteriota bacterium]
MLASLAFVTPLLGQEPHQNARTAQAFRVENKPKIDGNLNEAVWAAVIASASGFRQKEPHEAEPSSENTEIKIIYDDESLYFGITCYDSEPDKIRATELRRDNELSSDDSVWIILDTFHDHRNSFLFKTNPLGTKFDAQVTDEGKDLNPQWDEKWEVRARINDLGWTAEIEIPFKTLRVIDKKEQTWGIDFKRVVVRKNEEALWSNYDRDFKFEDVSKAGHLRGLDNIQKGLKLRIKPFVIAGVSSLSREGKSETDNRSEGGLEILKYRITPSLSADFTFNTDFAQTEVDQVVINLTRFPLFFPEKREFFLEGAGIFQFSTEKDRRGVPDFKFFHSRRIGLSPNGEVIPIIGGARVAGKLKGLSLGLLSMQTDDFKDIPGSNFSVLRIKRDIFSRSSIGVMVTNRQSRRKDDFNRVYGLDANLVFLENLRVGSFLAKSQSPEVTEGDWTYGTEANYETDSWLLEGAHIVIRENFNPEIGFVRRKDIDKNFTRIGIKPRPRIEWIRQLILSTRFDYHTDHEGVLQNRTHHFFTLETRFESGDLLRIDNHRTLERLDRRFEIRPGLFIPAGTYRGRDVSLQLDLNSRRKVAGQLGFAQESGFYRGSRISFDVNPRFRLSEQLSFDAGYGFNDVQLPQGDFRANLLNSVINYSLNNRWLASTMIQYNSADKLFNLNFRLNHIFRSSDNVFLVYNESRSRSDVQGRRTDRSILVKVTYSFDF